MSDGYDFDVPLMRPTYRRSGSVSGSIREMPKGASKFFPGAKINIVINAGCVLRKRNHIDFKLTCRTVIENGVAGVRVWRLDAE
jgi:hypothetical protein